MSRVASKILRILLVFSLTFMFTWHLEYSLAYGSEPTGENAAGDTSAPPEGEGGATSSSDTPGNSSGTDDPAPSNPDPGSSDPNPGDTPGEDPGEDPNPNPNPGGEDPVDPPAFTPYIVRVEILKADGTYDPKDPDNPDGHFKNNEILEIKNEKESKYEFRLRVTYVADLSQKDNPPNVTLGPKDKLSTATNGAFDDEAIKWEIYTKEEGSDKELPVPKEQASIDEKTGVLTIKPGLKIHVRAYTKKGEFSDYVPHTLNVVSTDSSEEESSSSSSEPEQPIEPVTITYDLNGVEGEISPTQSGEDGNATVANLPEGIEAPAEKKFGGWNTKADGTGTSFSPGAIINSRLIAEIETPTPSDSETTDGENEDGANQEGESSDSEPATSSNTEENSDPSSSAPEPQVPSSGPSDSNVLSLVLYAQWVDESDDDKGDNLVRISYIPSPLGYDATLTPILADVGHITFYYEWEVSKDGGESWAYVQNEGSNPIVLKVPTTEETIGWKYRVNVRILGNGFTDKDGNVSNTFTSNPVTIREGEGAILEYEPTWENEDAVFNVRLYQKLETSVSYEWYVSSNYGRNWDIIPDANSEIYRVKTDESTMGNWYRVKVRGTNISKDHTCDEGTTGDECECSPDVACTNIQMLVALSDADPSDFDPSEGSSSSGEPGGEGSSDSSSSSSGDSSSSGSGEPGPSEQGGSSESGDSSSSESGTAPSQENTQPPSQQPPSSPTPAPQNTPTQPSQLVPIDSITKADEATPAPEAPGLNIQVDPEVTEKINEEVAAQEEKTTGQLGQRWRKLSVIPQQEEIKEVLADNPFAPFVLPLTVALVACGMVERLVFFRRQKQDSGAAFA